MTLTTRRQRRRCTTQPGPTPAEVLTARMARYDPDPNDDDIAYDRTTDDLADLFGHPLEE